MHSKIRISEVMEILNHREREILRLRYGLADGYSYTLEEVGKIFSVTRERVRQIESKAVRKLQEPYRSRRLAGFLDLPPEMVREYERPNFINETRPPQPRPATFISECKQLVATRSHLRFDVD